MWKMRRRRAERELFADLGGQGLDLFGEGDQHGQQRAGGVGFGGAVVAGGAVWCGAETGVQHAGIDAAAVADAGQPGRSAAWARASRRGPGSRSGSGRSS